MVYSLKNVHQADDTMPASRDVSNSRNSSKSSADKLSEKEASFDSGIISSAEISQAYSTEVDSLYALSAEYDSRSELRKHPSSTSPSRKNKISERLDSEDQQMGLSGLSITDSGVYTEVSERLCDNVIKEYYDEIDAKSTSKTKSTDTTTVESKGRTSSSRDDFLRNIFTQDEDGDTQLHLAILRDDLKVITEILKMIPSADYVNIRNYHWQTCLHLSVLMNSPQVTRLLVLAGAKIDVEDRNGNSPLHLACKCDHVECVIALLNPLNVDEEKYIVFQYKPIMTRSFECLNQYNYDGLSCLHLAAEHQDRRVLRYLLAYGADINISECKGGYTLLHEAVELGDVNLVNLLLRYPDIDMNRKNYARRTAYQLASRHPSIRKLLLENGSQFIESEDEEDSETESEESEDEEYCCAV